VRVHHVTREVPPEALEACLAFYALLGFAPADAPSGIAERARWLELSGTQLHLLVNPGARPAPGHVALVAPAYDDLLASLTAAGHEIEPRREHWGSPRCYVRDPAGHLVELMAFPPG
jgi:catechol 2,3-dioxygenase-like lactoylglutathione lyase family enzyme